MIFEQVVSLGGLDKRFCGFSAEKPKYLVRGDCFQSPRQILTSFFILLVVGLAVRGTDLTANRTITFVIDFAPTGATLVIGGRLDVSPTRFDFSNQIIYLPTFCVELVECGWGGLSSQPSSRRTHLWVFTSFVMSPMGLISILLWTTSQQGLLLSFWGFYIKPPKTQ
eukprot:TRINITY_DN11520_c0_g1_i5.p1 TRINITY_DN11520_c0_g1~~TRINITY_DN11520_c0_g1_i5.p1  ORF type:complete len:167 (-),score=9.29 TRINITY_DN11520_c0_g1_i5:369-869(-)